MRSPNFRAANRGISPSVLSIEPYPPLPDPSCFPVKQIELYFDWNRCWVAPSYIYEVLQQDGAVPLPGSLIDLRIEGHLPLQTNPLRAIYPATLRTPTGEVAQCLI